MANCYVTEGVVRRGTSSERCITGCQVTESASGLAFSVDSRLRISAWDEEMATATGKRSREVLGRLYYTVLPPILRNGSDPLGRVIETGRNSRIKGYRFGCLFGEATADLSIRSGRNGSGMMEATVVISNLRPCATAQKLRDSRRLIDIGKTASALAHGVRNPLNAIKGSVVYLSERYADEPALLEFTKIMQDEIARLDGFIARFLSTSLAQPAAERTDVRRLLAKVKVVTSLQSRARGITADFSAEGILLVHADSFHLEQAVLNVVNNAIEAMEAGGRLSIKAFRTGDGPDCEQDCVVIEVADTGPGIGSKNVVEDIPTSSNGRGFGLFLARETLRSAGGQLQINSSRGQGTTVRMLLPAADQGLVR